MSGVSQVKGAKQEQNVSVTSEAGGELGFGNINTLLIAGQDTQPETDSPHWNVCPHAATVWDTARPAAWPEGTCDVSGRLPGALRGWEEGRFSGGGTPWAWTAPGGAVVGAGPPSQPRHT